VSATPPVAVVGPVLVIGTGLIGTSIALALTRAGVRVLLDDVDSEPITIAVNRGAGEVFDHENSHVPPFAIVVIAVPPRFAAQVIAQASQDFPTSTITDVTSVKSGILQQAIAMGADASRLVGGHPMAGREVAGAVGARKDLFDDRLWIVSPCQEAGALHHQNVTNLAITCGAVPIDMSPQEHDRAVALVSHAPQVVSSALAAQLLPAQANHIAVAGQGLRDMTRIAASDSSLWVDILSQNAGPVSEVLNGVVRELQEVLDALQEIRITKKKSMPL